MPKVERRGGKDVAVIASDADTLAVRNTVERLLKRPLTADAAVQIALLNNRGLQAVYNELGIAVLTLHSFSYQSCSSRCFS